MMALRRPQRTRTCRVRIRPSGAVLNGKRRSEAGRLPLPLPDEPQSWDQTTAEIKEERDADLDGQRPRQAPQANLGSAFVPARKPYDLLPPFSSLSPIWASSCS